MARSKSSRRWLKEHFDDPYVQRAQKEGHRGRAIYKLIEIQEKDRILSPGMVVVDLGAAPGSWSEYAVKAVADAGYVFALDILPMEPIPGTTILQGDFREADVLARLRAALGGRPVDLVMSDMAPNISWYARRRSAARNALGGIGAGIGRRGPQTGWGFAGESVSRRRVR